MIIDNTPEPNADALRSGMKMYKEMPCLCCYHKKATEFPKHEKCLQMVAVRVPGMDEPIFISACKECDGLVNG